MALRNEANFSDIKYEGKKAELIAESKEKKEQGIERESNSDYNSIRSIEQRGPIDKENKYNSAEEEEGFSKPGNQYVNYVNIEDVAGENEDSIIDMVDKKIIKDKGIIEEDNSVDDYIAYIQTDLDIIDSYGYAEIFEKLIESARVSKDYKEIDNILDRTTLFIKEYQNILKEHLPEAEEREAVSLTFKKTVGDVVYMKSGETGEKSEILAGYSPTRDARPGANRGQKIYYSEGKVAHGFLSQKGADNFNKRQIIKKEENNNNQSQGNNQKYSQKKHKPAVQEIKNDVLVYNPLTRKKEKM